MAYPSPAESALIYSTLPFWIVLLPLAGSFFVYLCGLKRASLRDMGALLLAGVTLALAVALYIEAGSGFVELKLRAGFVQAMLYFRVDRLGALLTLLSALIWFLATAFSISYMRHEADQNRYYLFFLLSLGSCLGVFMTGDLLSLFLFFEIMTFASYVLVVHSRTAEADEAGRNYLFMGVLGGLLLLAAILLMYFHTGSLDLAPTLEALKRMGRLRYLAAFLFIAGFGIKAGAVPLHIWLPKAHPVAPSPASALLSGIMIKTGAYGILRVVNLIFSPRLPEVSGWQTPGQLGLVMIWVGIATMLTAALMALFQFNAKHILAYSSISQMGYMLMGIGAAAYLGPHGAIGLSGTVYHIVNHAFFKAGMFMMIGAVYVRTQHQLDLRRLGGLWRSMPVTTAAFLAAAAGITGVPLFNGYTGKTLLHHAIVEAAERHHLFSLALAEKIFTVTGALTVCYIIKLTYGVFFGKRPPGLKHIPPETARERLIFAFMGAAIIALGSFPSLFLNRVIIPAAGGFGFDEGSIKYLARLNFWDMHDLQSMVLVLAAGALLYLALRPRFERVKLPSWLSVEQVVYRPLIRTAAALYTGSSRAVEAAVDNSYIYSPYALRLFTLCGYALDSAAELALVQSIKPLSRICYKLAALDREGLPWLGRRLQLAAVKLRDGVYNLWYKGLRLIMVNGLQFLRRLFFTLVHMDFNPQGIRLFQVLNISNLDFNLILILTFLLILLSLFFFL